MIHWHTKFKAKSNAGIAYVTLGRSRELKDIFIKGKLEKEGIHASPEALDETHRLQLLFDNKVVKLNENAEIGCKGQKIVTEFVARGRGAANERACFSFTQMRISDRWKVREKRKI